jgi:hypothetical protein
MTLDWTSILFFAVKMKNRRINGISSFLLPNSPPYNEKIIYFLPYGTCSIFQLIGLKCCFKIKGIPYSRKPSKTQIPFKFPSFELSDFLGHLNYGNDSAKMLISWRSSWRPNIQDLKVHDTTFSFIILPFKTNFFDHKGSLRPAPKFWVSSEGTLCRLASFFLCCS